MAQTESTFSQICWSFSRGERYQCYTAGGSLYFVSHIEFDWTVNVFVAKLEILAMITNSDLPYIWSENYCFDDEITKVSHTGHRRHRTAVLLPFILKCLPSVMSKRGGPPKKNHYLQGYSDTAIAKVLSTSKTSGRILDGSLRLYFFFSTLSIEAAMKTVGRLRKLTLETAQDVEIKWSPSRMTPRPHILLSIRSSAIPTITLIDSEGQPNLFPPSRPLSGSEID